MARAWEAFFTNFTTPHLVVIRAKSLRIPELILELCLILGIIFTVIVPLNFMKRESLMMDTTMEIRAPLVDFWGSGCTYMEQNCEVVKPDLAKCSAELPDKFTCCLPPTPKTVKPNGGAISRSSLELVFSMFKSISHCEVPHDACEATQGSCKPGRQTRYAYADIDTYLLFLRHRFESLDSGWSRTAADLQGFLDVPGQRPCRLHNKVSAVGIVEHESFFEKMYPDLCGTSTGNGTNSAMTSGQGDYISIGLLLKAANMSTQTITERGGAMSLQVGYTNMDFADFWSWPWGPKPKYTLRPEKKKWGKGQTVFLQDSEQISKAERQVTIRPILYLSIHVSGEHGSFSFMALLTKLTVCSIAFTTAKLVVNEVLVYIYKHTGLRHVHELHSLSVKIDTRSEEDFHSAYQKASEREATSRDRYLRLAAGIPVPADHDHNREDSPPRR